MLKPSLQKLTEQHNLAGFSCGAEEIDDWVHKRAWKGQIVGNANVFVFEAAGEVLGFYALATGGVERLEAPRSARQNAPETVPVLLLARLGVATKAQGRRIGAALLQDALLRTLEISENVGFRALLIHCRDETARDFYVHQVTSFKESPSDPLHLFLALRALVDFTRS
ncbi:MAG: GNAT family N-acetyltransferase [Actinomycetota bacterium]|nr:GNAT family N-acetyltransferase [Actinomycetota bacterium]